MITITASSSTANPGSTVCVVVTGCTTPPTVKASLGTMSLVPRITGSDGQYLVCVTLPPGKKGILDFRIMAGNDADTIDIGVG